MDKYQQYIHVSKYARFIDELGRRETWAETVQRYINFFGDRFNLDPDDRAALYDGIYQMKAMPSMRAMMTAGPALIKDNAAAFNCCAFGLDNPRCFDEAFYLLMCGCGVGFSVARNYTKKMPEINDEMFETDTVIVVADSKIGWARALKELIAMLYTGNIPKWDLSKIRPAGARLKTFGGRASGPLPLDRLFKYTVRVFKNATGRRLTSIECHDLMCQIAKTVIVGSVRRSAMISFSNLSDDRMRRAKTGDWYPTNPERALANNSVMYTCKPDLISFITEFQSMYVSKAGERGMCNQEALQAKAKACGREYDGFYLLNPCGESILRDSGGMCNLSEVVARPEDTLDDLKDKVRLATIFGTMQSTLTDFRYLRKIWQTNAIEDPLLGVSITGVKDHPILCGYDEYKATGKFVMASEWLAELKQVAKEVNQEWAKKLGCKPATQISLVKPSGTVSQLVNCSSGMHPRFSPFFLRKVAQDIKDPLSQMMIDQGIPHYQDGDKYYFEFPIAAPIEAICIKDVDPIYQLELWKVYQSVWCDGNPSQTIYYDDNSFLGVQEWVYRNWDTIGGLSFFPHDDNIHPNSPYTEISEEQYNKLVSEFPVDIDFTRLGQYETEDCTTSMKEISCGGGACEL